MYLLHSYQMLFILDNLFSSSSHLSTRSRGGNKRWLSGTANGYVKVLMTILEVRMKNITRMLPIIIRGFLFLKNTSNMALYNIYQNIMSTYSH